MHTKLYFIDKQLAISPKPRGGEGLGSKARTLNIPDTEEQEKWLEEFWEKNKKSINTTF